jgi:hypothetical protein
LCLCGHFSPAKAATPREELLRLVPEDVGFCLVIQDLRGHSERCLSSPFVKELRDSPIGQTIRQAPETRKLAEFDRHIQQVLGVSLAQLRDDICGDAVILAYRPGHPGKEEQEEGLLLVRARDARVLSRLVDRWNENQKQSGDLLKLQVRNHEGVEYSCRVERRGENFAWLHGSLLAFATREAMLKKVIELDRAPAGNQPFVSQQLDRLGAANALAALWINPRVFDAHLQHKIKQAQGPEVAVLQAVLAYWKALEGIAVSAALQKSEMELSLAILAKGELLPPAARSSFAGDAKASELWRAFPENALFAMAGKCEAGDLNDFFSEFLPADKRQWVHEAMNRFAAAPLGKKDLVKEVLPFVGPDWGFCILAPSAEEKTWVPHSIWALRVRPGSVDRSLLNALHSFAFLGVLAYNGSHPDKITLHPLLQDKVEGNYLANDQQFPPGFQPTFALKDGYLVVASSPEAIRRFSSSAPSAAKNTPEIPLVRLGLKEVASYLKAHQDALIDYVAQKNQLSKEEAVRHLQGLAQVCQFFDRLEITHRSGSGKLTVVLRIHTAQPVEN